MSVLTDAVIVSMFGDDDAIEQVNNYLYEEDQERHQQFEKLDNSVAGGTKVSSITTYQACFNHLQPDIVVSAFLKANWRSKTNVLMLWYEFEDHPQMIFHDPGKPGKRGTWMAQIYG